MSRLKERMRILVERTADDATAQAADLCRSIVCEAVSARGRAMIALSGGTTPHALYERLARSSASGDVPWRGVQIFFGDERDVPLDDAESNFNMVRSAMLDELPIDPTSVHAMRADAADLPAAAAEYEQTLRRVFGTPEGQIPRFDLMLLGMGYDGHTASLFPGTAALDEKEKLVVAVHVPVMGRWRLTMTYPIINAARNTLFLVTGADKAQVVATLVGDDAQAQQRLPAARISPTDDSCCILVLDAAAARDAGIRPT